MSNIVKAPKERPLLAGSNAVLAALRQRYENERNRPPTYALFTEVSNGTGGNLTNYADAIVMCLWPSRGYTIAGFEIKCSRTDWLRELAEPSKCEPIFKFCDEWWIAVSDETIVRDGELPHTWGLLVPDKKGGLRIHTKAGLRRKAEPISRAFLAAILRRAMQQSTDVTMLAAARAEGKQEAEQRLELLHKTNRDEYDALRKKIGTFERASGVSIEMGWHSATAVGDAVRQVLRGSMPVESMRRLAGDAAKIQSEILQAVELYEATEPARTK